MRLYLDTNILTKLSNHPQLENLLNEFGEYINIVYSEAHIDDLSRGNDNEKTRIDLETIAKLTHNQCMAKYMKNLHVTYENRDPVEFMETMREAGFSPTNLNHLNDEIEKIDFKSLGLENPMDKLNTALSQFNEVVLKNLDSTEYNYSTLFKQSSTSPSLSSLIADMMNLINGSDAAKGFFQHTRELMDKHVKSRAELSNEKDPITFLNNLLPETVFAKSFDDFTDIGMQIGKTHLGDQGEKEHFITRYSNLDLLGYRSDSKMSVQNINTDATHAYYGGHCDVFITQDKKLRAKAEAMYKEFYTETIIVDVKEACEQIPLSITNFSNAQDFISQALRYTNLPLVDYFSDITDKRTTAVRVLNDLFLGYFDENMHHTLPEAGFISIFYKATPTLSKWIFKREYALLTNKLASLLGKDNYGNGVFMEWSEEFSEDGEWRGRYWGKDSGITLKDTEEFGITLLTRHQA